MLDHKNIKVKLNTDFKDLKDEDFERVFYTGPIDEFFNYKFGQLPYRSVNFKFETYDKRILSAKCLCKLSLQLRFYKNS